MSGNGTPGAASNGSFLEHVVGLPQPLHLFAYLTGGHHYHFGLFERPREPLVQAMDRLADSCAAHLPPGGRILDVGCGLGGSTQRLGRAGFDVLGIDTCESSIAFAHATLPTSERLRFEVCSFLAAAGRQTAGFDALLFIEVLQHLPLLSLMLGQARALLRPAGLLVFSDVFLVADLPWRRAPFHRSQRLRQAAAEFGLQLRSRQVLTEAVEPTLERLLVGMEEQREAMSRHFAGRRPQLEHERAELTSHLAVLAAALNNGDLAYEQLVFSRGPA